MTDQPLTIEAQATQARLARQAEMIAAKIKEAPSIAEQVAAEPALERSEGPKRSSKKGGTPYTVSVTGVGLSEVANEISKRSIKKGKA